ncbi:MAG: ATP-binding response regulator [Roseburia sp. 1XD42-69]
MKQKKNRSRKDKGIHLLLSMILLFSVLGVIVFSVARRISADMSASAIQNLSESLDLIKCTIESMLKKDAEYQKLMAGEIAREDDPKEYILTYKKSPSMTKISYIPAGEEKGISNTGEIFTAEELNFSSQGTAEGLEISQSYLNYMGTWAYSMVCPVERDGEKIGMLYVEYVYDSLDKSLPKGFYNQKAMLYVMDARSQKLVLKPKGMGERSAGHLNLEDFYRANAITEQKLKEEVSLCISNGENIMFYHDILGKSALNYMWALNGGSIYLIGYVPVEEIQQEGRSVNQNIFLVVLSMLIAFFLCFILYYLNQRQQEKLRRERETEREMHNKQLAEALKAAQIASESKTTFLSNMSHDIRTPMNAVLGFTTLLAMDAENPVKVREYTKKITASGKHLLSLINDVLDVSKIESGKVVLNYEKFTLSDLVSSVDAIIRPMAQEREQHFYVEVTGVAHEILVGDETRINQILINLLSNAVKYTQRGGCIYFRILGLKQRSPQYEHFRIEVEDNGYGMTPEYLETIFDAFTRAENSTTNKVQGTGLGMAITKNIVELMGGTIEVSSQVDKGTVFQVELECRIPEDREDMLFWEEKGITRIFAVGADEEICRNIEISMKDFGVTVDTVSGIARAMEFLRDTEETYQIVLLDFDLPNQESIHGAEKIRELLPEIPIVFLASWDAEFLEKALEMENGEVMTKPFFVSALKEKVKNLLEGSEKESAQKEEESSGLSGLNFLAAEDNEINAEILKEILEMEGAGCLIVENGRLAVERFEKSEKGEFDAILMDVQMPVMNGYEATRNIRALDREDAGEIPIIAMTANAFAEDEKAALDAGMNVHVAKPIDMELLKRVIREHVKKGDRIWGRERE